MKTFTNKQQQNITKKICKQLEFFGFVLNGEIYRLSIDAENTLCIQPPFGSRSKSNSWQFLICKTDASDNAWMGGSGTLSFAAMFATPTQVMKTIIDKTKFYGYVEGKMDIKNELNALIKPFVESAKNL